jgi:protein-disulfide isomerase
MKIGLAAAAFAAVGLLAGSGMYAAAAESDSFTEGQVKSIEKIVKDYLIAHPEVLQEVQESFERKAEAARADITRAHLPALYKAMAGMKASLDSMSVGSGDITVIEFFDYNCGYCRKTLPDVVKLIENEPGVKVQFMEYPILAAESREAARVAVAASKQGKYFEFHKAMFSINRASKDSALKAAEQAGCDMSKIAIDAAAPETDSVLSQIAEAAKTMMIDGTPTFIVGDKVNPGWTQYEQLKEFVAQARKDGCKACAGAGAAGDGKKS